MIRKRIANKLSISSKAVVQTVSVRGLSASLYIKLHGDIGRVNPTQQLKEDDAAAQYDSNDRS